MLPSTTQTAPQTDLPLPPHFYVADHREAWPRILPGLEKFHALFPDQDWTIEGLRRMLDDDQAFLIADASDPCAFAFARIDDYPYSAGELELFILAMWHEGADMLKRIDPYLELMAATGGAKYVRFYSRRPGMARLVHAYGYNAHNVEYVKELSHVIR
jgi:hypothetical protein